MTFRAITAGLDDFAKVSPPRDLGPVPDQRWLPIDKLVVDEAYQRQIGGAGRKNVRGIAENFSWSKFSAVVVAPIAGGGYAIIDGQHRTTAAALLGFSEVPCQIIIASQAQQAEAFTAINGATTTMSSLALFAARVAAGDAEAVALAEACSSCGVEILRYPIQASQLKIGQTIATGALQRIWKRAGRDLLVIGLNAIMKSANRVTPGILKAPIITAVIEVLEDAPEWQQAGEALFDAFDTIELLQALADSTAEAARRGGITATAVLKGKIADHLTRQFG